MKISQQDSETMRTLLWDVNKENLKDTFAAARKIANKYRDAPTGEPQPFADIFQQLSHLWLSYYPDAPIPGSTAANQK